MQVLGESSGELLIQLQWESGRLPGGGEDRARSEEQATRLGWHVDTVGH